MSGLFISKKPLKIDSKLALDFEGFGRIKQHLQVKLNGQEFRAEILEDLLFEDAKAKCENNSGSLAWNRVKRFPDIGSYWIECGNRTDRDDKNARDACSEVSN